jgi:ABC-2 type transport system ATP-binding protein
MVMDRCWLTDRQRQTIGTLSKGYRQRVGLADAMVADPEILILDEPTIGLDPNQVRQVRTLIRELGQDHTVVLSTHILPEVEMVCDKVVIINSGRIVMQERLEALRRNTGPDAEYYIEVQGPLDQVRATIAAVRGVSDLREHAHGDKGTPGFVIRVPRQGDAISAVVSAVIQKGYKVREVRRRERTLEDIFIEVVGRDTALAV